MTDAWRSSTKKTAAAVMLTVLLGPGVAGATRLVGDIAWLPAARASGVPVAPTYSGVVTAVRSTHPRGIEIEIDGRWWLVLHGRTSVLHDRQLVDERALVVGQAVRYVPATTMRGETALGVVHVP